MRTLRRVEAAACVALFLSAAIPRSEASSLSLGTAANYAVFDYNSMSMLNFSGAGEIHGDVAVARNTQINFSKPAVINGTLYEDSGVTGSTGGITITGGIKSASLSQVISDANSASSTAKGLSTTGSIPGNQVSESGTGHNLTFNGQTGQNVVDLTMINLSNGGTFTIHGTSTETFIFNASNGFNVSSASILLTGGVTANHVLFNITGSNVNISGTSSVVNGTILASAEQVMMSGGTLNGAIVSGANINISGKNTTINQVGFNSGSAVPEPPAYVLAGFASFFGLGTAAVRVRRRRAADPRFA